MTSRTLAVTLFALLFCTAGLCQQAPSFRSQTNLVLVPVQVRDHGQHVSGLKQEAFTLLEDGRPQKIATFEEIRTSTQRLRPMPVGPREFTDQLLGSPETARYTVIAIDRMNTAPLDMMRVRDGLTKFLTEASDTGEPIRLISIESNAIRLIQDFTTDPSLIRAALKRATSGSGASPEQSSIGTDEYTREVEWALNTTTDSAEAARLANLLAVLDKAKQLDNARLAFQERETRLTSLDALQQVALSLSGFPGRKSLVWASSGYPFASIVKQTDSSGIRYDYSHIGEALDMDAYTTHLLSASNIAMYPVDARGMTNIAWDSIDPSHKYSPTAAERAYRQRNNTDILSTFDHLAAGTGGKPCYNRPDLANCFKEALDDSRDYYMLGFYVDKNTKEGWHKLQVKVEGDTARSRTGFLFPLPDPEKTRELDMNTAVHSLLPEVGIPFKGEWTTTAKKGDKVANRFLLQVASTANVVNSDQRKLNLEFLGVARSRDGAIAGQFAQRIAKDLSPEAVATVQKEGITYNYTLDLPPGEYLVRFVVRDNNTGRTGAANSFLKVE